MSFNPLAHFDSHEASADENQNSSLSQQQIHKYCDRYEGIILKSL
jgi:hypothetical protein